MAIISNGTTIADAGAFSASLGSYVHLNTTNLNNASNCTLTHGTGGVDFSSNYKSFEVKFINIHPSADNSDFQFNVSIDSGSNFGINKTNTFYSVIHTEGDGAYYEYSTAMDMHNNGGYSKLTDNTGNANDENLSGTFRLYDPSNTTMMKAFQCRIINHEGSPSCIDTKVAGYIMTFYAINSLRFQFAGANMTGKIKLYGVKD